MTRADSSVPLIDHDLSDLGYPKGTQPLRCSFIHELSVLGHDPEYI